MNSHTITEEELIAASFTRKTYASSSKENKQLDMLFDSEGVKYEVVCNGDIFRTSSPQRAAAFYNNI